MQQLHGADTNKQAAKTLEPQHQNQNLDALFVSNSRHRWKLKSVNKQLTIDIVEHYTSKVIDSK